MRPSESPMRSARGQVLVLFALGLLVFLGFAALTVDYAYWLSEKRLLQNAVDAAAQAGVSELLRRPITTDQQVAAARHAMSYVDDQIGLGLKANGQLNCAAAAAADPAENGFGSEDCLNYLGPDRVIIRTPVDGSASCEGGAWGSRAVTVKIQHRSSRFFSRIFEGGDPWIAVCATSAIQGGSLAIAVLKPNQTAPGVFETQPNNATITMKLAGQNSYVRIWGGDVGINSLYSAAGAPPPASPNEPAYVKFMTAAATGISDNRMLMTIEDPNPITWDIDAKQVRTEGISDIESDDLYHPPVHLAGYIPIPAWGDVAYAGLADGSVTPIELPKGDPSVGTTCMDPVTGDPGVDPGMYSLLAADNDARRWLCPGVFHFVHKSGTEGLQLGTGSVVAGQGVTLVFENDSELRVDGGGTLILNCLTSGKPECANPIPAPWRTGDTRHDLPITIWIKPVPGCDPRAAACGNSSTVFDMTAGAGMDIRGIIYGPTDDMKIAGNGDHHGSGEIWAWTITYAGNSTLDQVYEGSDDGYPLIVE